MAIEAQPTHVFSIDGALTIEVKRLRKRTELGEVGEYQVWSYAIKHLGTTIFTGKDLVTDLYEPNTYAAAKALFLHMPNKGERGAPNWFDTSTFNVKQYAWFANMAELYREASNNTHISHFPGVTLILSDGTVVPFDQNGEPIMTQPEAEVEVPYGFELTDEV